MLLLQNANLCNTCDWLSKSSRPFWWKNVNHLFDRFALGFLFFRWQNDFLYFDHLRLIQFKKHQLIVPLFHKLPPETILQTLFPFHNVEKCLSQTTATQCACTPAALFQSSPVNSIRIALFAWPNCNTAVNRVQKQFHILHIFKLFQTGSIEPQLTIGDRHCRVLQCRKILSPYHLISR